MPKPPPVALTGIRDILVGLTEEGRGDETASALGIGLSSRGWPAPISPSNRRPAA